MLARFTGNFFKFLIPSTSAWPEVGTSKPHIILKVVDLPAPFGPSKPKISPRLTAKVHAIGGGKITKFLGQFFRFDHRLAGCAFYRMQYCTQRRF